RRPGRDRRGCRGRCLLRLASAREPARRLGIETVRHAGIARGLRAAHGRTGGRVRRSPGAASAALDRPARASRADRVLVRRAIPPARALAVRVRTGRSVQQADAVLVYGQWSGYWTHRILCLTAEHTVAQNA